MHARKLPTILELMESNVGDGLQPINECRMGEFISNIGWFKCRGLLIGSMRCTSEARN